MSRSIKKTTKRGWPACFFIMLALPTAPVTKGGEPSESFSRDLNVAIVVNPVGYLPHASKKCFRSDAVKGPFKVIETTTGKVVFSGTFQSISGDFGKASVGDFSPLNEPGHYYIQSRQARSRPFRVAQALHNKPIDKILGYFATQRCGPSATGYFTPCHLDDGVRKDNGRHQDVTGGWHDASDLRKWVGATLYGMIGLGNLLQSVENDELRATILEELRWGNRYFLKMQEAEGYVMSHIGGAIREHGDNNRWTDNRIGKEDGQLRTLKPKRGQSSDPLTVIGSKDDRVIQTDPLDTTGQYNFVHAEALMARATTGKKEYRERCLRAAKEAWRWAMENRPPKTARAFGASILAGVELTLATDNAEYKGQVVGLAERLRALQATEPIGNNPAISGFFFASSEKKRAHRDIWHGRLPFLSFCRLAESFPEHSDAEQWREVIDRYSRDYLATLAEQNAYGMVPLGLYTGENPGGGREVGPYWYRYFMRPVEGWWVGVNAHVAGAGIGLMKAAEILNDKELAALAQRQLDWILGVNPLAASTMEGIGPNQPEPFVNTIEFQPATPKIPGAVMNGLGGTKNDQPARYDGSYHTAEYWTPMVGLTAWLFGEIRYK